MGIFSKRSQTITQEPLITDEQKAAQSALANFIKTGQLGAYQAGQSYDGDLGNYDISVLEQSGQDKLSELVGRDGVNKNFSAGTNELNNILNTNFNESDQSGIFNAFKAISNTNLQDSSDALKRQLGVTGNLYSTQNAKEHRRLNEDNTNNLNLTLAQLVSQFSDRRQQAAGQSINAGIAEEGVDQNRISASQQYGQLQRILEDAKAKDKYGEFLRKHSELSVLPQAAQNLFSTNVPYGVKSITKEKPSLIMSMLGEVNPVIGSYNQHQYGYSTGQSSISDLVSLLPKLLSGGAGGLAGSPGDIAGSPA